METTDFIRQVLDTMTPAILQGQMELSPQLEAEILRGLKKAAVSSFATGNLNEAREINDFINSKPKFRIWPGNGLLYMSMNHGREIPENEVLVYSKPDHIGGFDQLCRDVEKIKNKQ